METVDVIDGAVQTAQPANLVNILNGQLSTRSTTFAVNPVNAVQNPTRPPQAAGPPAPKDASRSTTLNIDRSLKTSIHREETGADTERDVHDGRASERERSPGAGDPTRSDELIR